MAGSKFKLSSPGKKIRAENLKLELGHFLPRTQLGEWRERDLGSKSPSVSSDLPLSYPSPRQGGG